MKRSSEIIVSAPGRHYRPQRELGCGVVNALDVDNAFALREFGLLNVGCFVVAEWFEISGNMCTRGLRGSTVVLYTLRMHSIEDAVKGAGREKPDISQLHWFLAKPQCTSVAKKSEGFGKVF